MLHSTPQIIFNVTLEIQNPYGDIPASIYPYLPVILLFFSFFSFSVFFIFKKNDLFIS